MMAGRVSAVAKPWANCQAPACDNRARSAGSKHCEMHYYRLRLGSPLGLSPANRHCLQCDAPLAKPGCYCSLTCHARYRRGRPKGWRPTFKEQPVLVCAPIRQWRRLIDFPNYEISNDGMLRRASKGSNADAGKVIRFRINSVGYPQYQLSDSSGHRATRTAHNLVARAFLPAPAKGQIFILHNDDNKLNVCETNLRWGTPAENAADATLNGRRGIIHPSRLKPWTRPRGERGPSAKLTESTVRIIMASSETNKTLAQRYGVDNALIGRIKNGQVWKHVTNPAYKLFLENGAAMNPPLVRKRKRLTTLQTMKLLDNEKHTCHLCRLLIEPGQPWDVSHEIPLAMGGEDSEENRRAAHRACHRTHTSKVDIPAIAKSKRVRARHHGAYQSRRPMPYGKESLWKRKLTGEVVRRK